MAIYHLRLKLLSRALGRSASPGGATRRSAVAAAAYRSGERLFDDSQGKWFDFDKPDVVHTEILAPVDAPSWVFDRQSLWNMAERAEKRVDAQLAREVEITLPRELDLDSQVALIRRFVQDHFVAKGMVADYAIHRPLAADGGEQPHAHVMLTLRRLDSTSLSGFSSRKERDWNEPEAIARAVADARKLYNETRSQDDLDKLEAVEALRNVNVWRKAWADCANDALAESGSHARIDHRTLEKQGIFRPAQIPLGIARHIEKAYSYIRARVTQWVAIKKRSQLYEEVAGYRQRDPAQLTDFIHRLSDMAEEFAGNFRKSPDIPEADHDR